MTRKFKIAGVLMAVVAMFALTASSASALFTSSATPNTATATSTGDLFDAFGSEVKCTNNVFHIGKFNTTVKTGEHVAADFPTNTLTVIPTYSSCTAFGGLPATVNFTDCDYVFHTQTAFTVDLVCPAGVTGVDITVFGAADHKTAICHVTVHPFNGKGGLATTNNGAHVDVKGTVENITATQVRNSIFCPAGTHTATAKYTVQAAGITIKGNAAGSSVSVS